MHTIDYVYGTGIAVSIIIAAIFFTIAFRNENAEGVEEPNEPISEWDTDYLDCERPFVSFNDQFN